ncbi:hypothetical protein ACUH93_03535 [Dermabacteraceae bacterium P7006]
MPSPQELKTLPTVELYHEFSAGNSLSIAYRLHRDGETSAFATIDTNGMLDTIEVIPSHVPCSILRESGYLDFYRHVVSTYTPAQFDPAGLSELTERADWSITACLRDAIARSGLVSIAVADSDLMLVGLPVTLDGAALTLRQLDMKTMTLAEEETSVRLADIRLLEYVSQQKILLQKHLGLG